MSKQVRNVCRCILIIREKAGETRQESLTVLEERGKREGEGITGREHGFAVACFYVE